MHTLTTRTLFAAALLLAAAVSGCAGTAAATTTPVSAGPTFAGTTPGGAAPVKGSPTGPVSRKPATVAACRPDDLSATVTAQAHRTRGTTRMAIITLTNTSTRTCRVDGWPAVGLLNPANEAVPLDLTEVEQPGAAEPIDLKPGRGAPAGMKWTVCDKSDEDCAVGNALDAGLAGATSPHIATLEEFPAPEKVAITMKALQVGPMMASRQGVVAW